MTRAELLAQADAADREADQLFERISAKSDASPADHFGFRPLTPAGCEADAQRASDLRRRARWLREEAAELADPALPKSGAVDPRVTPPPPVLTPPPAAGPSPQPKQQRAVDPVDLLVIRIINS